ncbi:MAG: hypothetical protein KC420_08520 [Myxococcales bacterium]|nr:hypothetical protein [Myxococcales bacterium]
MRRFPTFVECDLYRATRAASITVAPRERRKIGREKGPVDRRELDRGRKSDRTMRPPVADAHPRLQVIGGAHALASVIDVVSLTRALT